MKAKRPATPAGPTPAAGLPLRNPALLAVALVAAALAALIVSFQMSDPDIWQHLTAGKVMWSEGRIPMTNFSTWSHLGEPQVLRSWLYCALIWPVYAGGGVLGLFAWRWITTLAIFGICWATARRMGARGLSALVVLLWCVLIYRSRSMVRPESLAAILMAAEFWILERRRAGGRDDSLWLIPILCLWANAHISYYVGLALIAVYWLDELWRRRARSRTPAGRRSLVLVGLASGAACFLNPWGWKALWLPFDYALHWSHEPIFAGIAELSPPVWSANLLDGLPAFMVLWPALAIARAARRGVDVAEALALIMFTGTALNSQRFLGAYAVAAAPFVARDLAGALARVRWPAVLARVPVRAAAVAVLCVAGTLPDLLRPELPIAVAFDARAYPIGAMDWLEKHQVRGRGFNHFGLAGYMLFRGWPDVGRLPFIDIHQTGSLRDRYEYAWAQQDPRAWRDLETRWRFDYAVLNHGVQRNVAALEILDADTTWSLCFVDDAAAVYLKNGGPHDALARRTRYRLLGGGNLRPRYAIAAVERDSLALTALREELDRAIAGSPQHAWALAMRGHAEQTAHHPALAESSYRAALRLARFVAGAHGGLGFLALGDGRPRDAVREFRAEWDDFGPGPGAAFNLAIAYDAAGDRAAARRWYARELKAYPGNAEARDSLAARDGAP